MKIGMIKSLYSGYYENCVGGGKMEQPFVVLVAETTMFLIQKKTNHLTIIPNDLISFRF